MAAQKVAGCSKWHPLRKHHQTVDAIWLAFDTQLEHASSRWPPDSMLVRQCTSGAGRFLVYIQWRPQ